MTRFGPHEVLEALLCFCDSGSRRSKAKDWKVRGHALHSKLSSAMYCNRSCLWVCVCLWVCYHDKSKLRASNLTKLGLQVKVVTISSWFNFGRPAPPGRGSAVGQNFWLRLTTASVQCLRLLRVLFLFLLSPGDIFTWSFYRSIRLSATVRFLKICGLMNLEYWCQGLERGLATLPHGNQESLVIKDKMSLGWRR